MKESLSFENGCSVLIQLGGTNYDFCSVLIFIDLGLEDRTNKTFSLLMFEGKSLSIDKKAISFLLPLLVQTSKELTTEIASREIQEIDEPMQQGCQSISLNHPLSFRLIKRNHTLSLLFKTKREYFIAALYFYYSLYVIVKCLHWKFYIAEGILAISNRNFFTLGVEGRGCFFNITYPEDLNSFWKGRTSYLSLFLSSKTQLI